MEKSVKQGKIKVNDETWPSGRRKTFMCYYYPLFKNYQFVCCLLKRHTLRKLVKLGGGVII